MTKCQMPALAAALALTLTGAAAAGQPPELTVEPHQFTTASGETVAAEIGRFRVPESRERAAGRPLELAFVRFGCTGERCGPPIVYLAGGPGGSGSGTARRARFPVFMALREHGDVIAFDQRGTGESQHDLGCDERYQLPMARPLDPLTA